MKMAGQWMLVTYAPPCIGICFYDPMLAGRPAPHHAAPDLETGGSPRSYADTGIRETLRKWSGEAPNGRGLAKIAGDSQAEVAGGGNLGNIGQRNIESP